MSDSRGETLSELWLIKLPLLTLASQPDRRMFVHNFIQSMDCLLYLFIEILFWVEDFVPINQFLSSKYRSLLNFE